MAAALSLALVGSITLGYPAGSQSASAQLVEVRMGALAAGSSAGSDFTEGVASVGGSLLSLRTDLLYLNNTAASPSFAKLVSVSASGASNLVSLEVGIDNGTASVPQITGTLGALTATEGAYVRLEPASVNRMYLTQAVTSLLAPDTRLTLDVYAADSSTGLAYTITNANLTIT